MKSKFLVMSFVALMCMFYSCKKQSNDLSDSELTGSEKNGGATTSGLTYYVSAGPDGLNSRTATQAQSAATPWKTIQHAVNNMVAGSTLVITGGTTYPYYEKISVPSTKSGTSTSRTIFKSKDAANPAIIDGSNTGTQWEALFKVQGNYITLENLRAQNGAWYGFQINTGSSNVTVNNCKTYNTQASGIYATGSTWITISNNKIQKACQKPTRDASGNGSQECITLTGCSDFYVRGNEVWDAAFWVGGEGIDAKGGSKNGVIHDNNVHETIAGGIYVDAGSGTASNIRVYNNKITNVKMAAIQIGGELGGTVREVYFYNNIVTNTSRWGTYFRPEGTFINVYVSNNTYYNNGTLASTLLVGGIRNDSNNPSNSNLVIKNNIIQNVSAEADFSISYNTGQSMVIDRNLYVDFKGNTAHRGTNYVLGTPGFLSPSTGDFRLASWSPAIGKAILVYSPISPYPVLYDFDYERKIRGYNCDIGAYEY